MSAIDLAAFVGSYPFRHLEHTSPEWLVHQMDRLEIERAWTGYLPAFLYRDPGPSLAALERVLEPHRDRLLPVPTVHPGLPDWRRDLERTVDIGAPAVRLYPNYQGLDADDNVLADAVREAAERHVAVVLTVRFEDARQRHSLDDVVDLSAAAVRAAARSAPQAKIVVSGAGRDFVEEVHFGLTPSEAGRVLWDISWIQGAPSDDLEVVLDTVGVRRFAIGTGMPLRIPDNVFAKLDLLELSREQRDAILSGNLEAWLGNAL